MGSLAKDVFGMSISAKYVLIKMIKLKGWSLEGTEMSTYTH